MPLYEYKCKSCEHIFSEICSLADREIHVKSPCPNCNESTVEINIAAVSTICPIRLGRVKPRSDFRERMKQIKNGHKAVKNNIKDY